MPNNKKIKIENGIKIPKITTGTVYPIYILKVGQSFFVELDRDSVYSAKKKMSNYAIQHSKTKIGKGKKFTLRTYDNGIRMWRIK